MAPIKLSAFLGPVVHVAVLPGDAGRRRLSDPSHEGLTSGPALGTLHEGGGPHSPGRESAAGSYAQVPTPALRAEP